MLRRPSFDTIYFLASLLASIALVCLVSDTFTFDSLDEGLIAASAMKMAGGSGLYKDIFEFWSPGLLTVTAIGFSIFGAKISVLRFLVSFLIIAATLSFFKFQRVLGFPSLVVFISTISLLLIDGSFVGLNNHWPAMVSLFLSGVALSNAFEYLDDRNCFFAGIMAGVTALFLQYEGAVAIAGGTFVLLSARTDSPKVKRWRALFMFWIGVVLLPALTLGYFAIHGAAFQLLFSTILFPLLYYRDSNGTTPSEFAFLQAAILLFVLINLRRSIWSTKKCIAATYAVALEAINLSNGNTANVVFNSYFVHLFIIYWIYLAFHPAAHRTTSLKRMMPASVAASIMIFLYGSALGRKLEVKLDWIVAASEPLETAAGRVFVEPKMRDKIATVLNWLKENPSNNVYFGPYAAYYYLFSGRLNPTAYSQMTTNYDTPEQFTEGIRQLSVARVNTIVFLPNESPFRVANDHPLSTLVYFGFNKLISLAEMGWRKSSRLMPDAEGIWRKDESIEVEPADTIADIKR